MRKVSNRSHAYRLLALATLLVAAPLVALLARDACADDDFPLFGADPPYGPMAPVASPPPRRDYRTRTHAYIGLRGLAATMTTYSDYDRQAWPPRDDASGGGIGAFAGIRAGVLTSVEASWSCTWYGDSFTSFAQKARLVGKGSWRMMRYGGHIKLHLDTEADVAPYLRVGGGWALLSAHVDSGDYRRIARGPVLNLGVGVDVWASPWLSVGGQLYYQGIWLSLDDGNFTNSYHGVGASLNLTVHL